MSFEAENNRLGQLRKAVQLAIDLYQSKLPVDSYNLETVCSEHSADYFAISSVYSKVNSFMKQMQLMAKEVESSASVQIRNDPLGFGIGKITESVVKETTQGISDVKEILRIKLKAEEYNLLIQGMLTAYEHRRSMVNNQVELRLSGLGEVGKQNKKEQAVENMVEKSKPCKIVRSRKIVRNKSDA